MVFKCIAQIPAVLSALFRAIPADDLLPAGAAAIYPYRVHYYQQTFFLSQVDHLFGVVEKGIIGAGKIFAFKRPYPVLIGAVWRGKGNNCTCMVLKPCRMRMSINSPASSRVRLLNRFQGVSAL
jgi:hypothetical protein